MILDMHSIVKKLKKLKWKSSKYLFEGISKTVEWYINNKVYFSNISKNLLKKD